MYDLDIAIALDSREGFAQDEEDAYYGRAEVDECDEVTHDIGGEG